MIPSWLSKSFFLDILKEDDNWENIMELVIEPANQKGENYASIMLRAVLKGTTTEGVELNRSLIVKLDPVGQTRDVMDQFNVFPKEAEMYSKILPAFSELFKNVGEEISFNPKCLKSASGYSDNFLILEDLCALDYKTANRQLGLDFTHAQVAISLLAKFHAASAVYYEKVKSFSNHFKYGLHAEHMKPVLYHIYYKNIYMMREISSTWECKETMSRFLDNYKEKMLDRVFELIESFQNSNRFKVLCHGDFWSNNVMFKYDENGRPIQCFLIDFQLANYNSPAFDLNYFIFTSLQKEIKLTHIDQVIHFYHSELVKNLRKLNFSGRIPELTELHRDFQELGPFGLNSSYGTLCAVVAPTGKNADMNSLLGDDEESKEFRRTLFSNPLYVEALEQLIPYFERKGLF